MFYSELKRLNLNSQRQLKHAVKSLNYFHCLKNRQTHRFQGDSHDLTSVSQVYDGDAVTLIKDFKVKGSSLVVKVGTKVKSIRLVEGDHNIDCKIEGFGAMKLKSEFVKKA